VTYIQQLEEFIKTLGYGTIATAVGRYYAMDRDKRWERIQVAYDGLVSGEGEETTDLGKTVQERYSKDETDEFLKPIIVNKSGLIGGQFPKFSFSFFILIQIDLVTSFDAFYADDDTILFFNYRSDRMREIVEAFGFDEKKFQPKKVPKNLVSFFPCVFPEGLVSNIHSHRCR